MHHTVLFHDFQPCRAGNKYTIPSLQCTNNDEPKCLLAESNPLSFAWQKSMTPAITMARAEPKKKAAERRCGYKILNKLHLVHFDVIDIPRWVWQLTALERVFRWISFAWGRSWPPCDEGSSVDRRDDEAWRSALDSFMHTSEISSGVGIVLLFDCPPFLRCLTGLSSMPSHTLVVPALPILVWTVRRRERYVNLTGCVNKFCNSTVTTVQR